MDCPASNRTERSVRFSRTRLQPVGGTCFAWSQGMDHEKPPRDSDPSEMTDFEKNATLEELERIVPKPDPNRARQEKGNTGPEEEPGFGQGASAGL